MVVVLVAFVNHKVDTYIIFIYAINGILDQDGIAIPFRVILGNDVFLVVLEIAFLKARRLEDARTIVVVEIFLNFIDSLQRFQRQHIGDGVHHRGAKWVERVEMATLLCLFHCRKYLGIRKVFIPFNVDFSDFHFPTFVNINNHIDITFAGCVGNLLNVNINIQIPFVEIIVLDDTARLGN